jgi:hypothetical protein
MRVTCMKRVEQLFAILRRAASVGLNYFKGYFKPDTDPTPDYPPIKPVHLALFFKDFAAWCQSSCVGLNVAGYTTAQVLRKNGYDVSVFPVRHNIDVVNNLEKNPSITHVVISAPWLSEFDLKNIIEAFPKIQFVILSHSNVGFLQADPGGVYLLRRYMELSRTHNNLVVGGNSFKFGYWLNLAYNYDAAILPNLYPISEHQHRKPIGDVIRIGAFGAPRPYKNFMTAAAAALVIQQMMGKPVEFHMTVGGESKGDLVLPAIEQMFAGTQVTLVKHDWSLWSNFIHTVKKMDLLIQVSYTESFNMITADGIYVGVPSVISPAIDWGPVSWTAEPDNAVYVAETGVKLLNHPKYFISGVEALERNNRIGLQAWKRFLEPECFM